MPSVVRDFNWDAYDNLHHGEHRGSQSKPCEVCYAVGMPASSPVRNIRVNQIPGSIISAAMQVHSLLGPGLLESAYQACLAHELRKRGIAVASPVGLPVVYDGEKIELGYRIDLVDTVATQELAE